MHGGAPSPSLGPTPSALPPVPVGPRLTVGQCEAVRLAAGRLYHSLGAERAQLARPLHTLGRVARACGGAAVMSAGQKLAGWDVRQPSVQATEA